MRKKWLHTLWTAAFLLVVLGGCKTEEVENDGKPVVYTSFYPVYDLVEQIAGDTVTLKSFMPGDKDPHLWEPTPKDMRQLAEADLLVVNGANMERWMDQVRENLPDLEVLTLSDSVDLITYKGAAAIGDFQYMCSWEAKAQTDYRISFGHTHEDIMRITLLRKTKERDASSLIDQGKKTMEAKGTVVPQKATIDVEEGVVYALEMGHESGEITLRFPEDGEWAFLSDRVSEKLLPYQLTDAKGDILPVDVLLEGSTSGLDKITYDPHSWISVVNGKKYLNSIYELFSQKYEQHTKLYKKNKLRAVEALTDLEYEYKDKFKAYENRNFVVTHYAYAYLARDFDLTQFPLQGLVSTESPSLKTIRKAIDYSEFHGIDTIFYEEGMDSKGAKTLAEEIGGTAESLNSMEYLKTGAKEEAGFASILRSNLEKLEASFRR